MYNRLNNRTRTGAPSTSKFFWVLQIIAQWNLMWIPRQPNGDLRYVCLTWLAWILSILLSLTYAYYTYYDAYQNELIYNIFCVLTIVTIITSRIISFYFFNKEFKYIWNNILEDYFLMNLKTYYAKRLNQTSLRIIIYLLTYIPLVWLFVSIEQINQKYYYFWENYIYWISAVFGIWIPIGVTQCIMTVIFLKYELFLYTLQIIIQTDKQLARARKSTTMTAEHTRNSEEMESTTGTFTADDVNTNFMSSLVNGSNIYVEELDFAEILMRYKKMRDRFNKAYKIWQIYMIIRMFMLFWMVWFWVENVFGNTFTRGRDIVMYIGSGVTCFMLPFIEYLISGTQLNQQFEKYNQCLWNYDVMLDDETDEKFDVATLPTINDDSNQYLQSSIRNNKYNYESKFDKKMKQSLLSRNVHGNRFDGSDSKHHIHNNWSSAYDYIRNTMFQIKDFYFMLQYVNAYPLIVTLYGYKITILNSFLLFMTLISVKLISFSILGDQY